jgi:hypothetical protein
MRVMLLGLALSMASGCAASHAYFRPTERVNAENAEGYSEALYELSSAQGRYGEAKVWSKGAYKDKAGDTVVQVGFELDNTGNSPLELDLDAMHLMTILTSHGHLADVPLTSKTGDPKVAPGSVGEVSAYFVIPGPVSPGDVRGFRVAWTAHVANEAFTQFTPFARLKKTYAYAPLWAYAGCYSPWACEAFYPPYFGWGFGASYFPLYYHYPVVVRGYAHPHDRDRR